MRTNNIAAITPDQKLVPKTISAAQHVYTVGKKKIILIMIEGLME